MARPKLVDSETRGRLVEAALRVFAGRGYHEATVDDIVEASKTSKGAFYHYFRSKEDIFLGLLNRLAGLIENGVEAAIGQEQGALAKVDAALRTVLEVAAAHQDLARVLLIQAAALGPRFEQGRLAIHRRFAVLIQRHLDRAVAEGAIPAQDTHAAATAWIGAINEVITQRLASGGDLQADIPALRTMLLRSIGANGAVGAAGTGSAPGAGGRDAAGRGSGPRGTA